MDKALNKSEKGIEKKTKTEFRKLKRIDKTLDKKRDMLEKKVKQKGC